MNYKKTLLSIVVVVSGLFAFNVSSMLPVSLKITILNELGNPEEGATVQLFTTDADYRVEKNAVCKAQLTNKNGKTTFRKLKPIIYFVNVTKGDKNNDGAGVQTDSLKTGFNRVTIIIE